jgi:hypothetical protein
MLLQTLFTQKKLVWGARFSHPLGSFSFNRTIHVDQFTHECGVDAEPLHNYRPGGYHLVLLGEDLKGERYKVLHKLGWGGYSTVWAARDRRFHLMVLYDEYVAHGLAENNSMLL